MVPCCWTDASPLHQLEPLPANSLPLLIYKHHGAAAGRGRAHIQSASKQGMQIDQWGYAQAWRERPPDSVTVHAAADMQRGLTAWKSSASR